MTRFITTLLLMLSISVVPLSWAEEAETDPSMNIDEQGRAIHGHDAVAYFTLKKAITGKPEFAHTWNGAEWFFVSAENLEKFKANPEQYAPSNGGYCTFGVVVKKKFDGNPQVWMVKNEALYLFLNEEVKGKFLQDETGNMQRIQDNWPTIKDVPSEEL